MDCDMHPNPNGRSTDPSQKTHPRVMADGDPGKILSESSDGSRKLRSTSSKSDQSGGMNRCCTAVLSPRGATRGGWHLSRIGDRQRRTRDPKLGIAISRKGRNRDPRGNMGSDLDPQMADRRVPCEAGVNFSGRVNDGVSLDRDSLYFRSGGIADVELDTLMAPSVSMHRIPAPKRTAANEFLSNLLQSVRPNGTSPTVHLADASMGNGCSSNNVSTNTLNNNQVRLEHGIGRAPDANSQAQGGQEDEQQDMMNLEEYEGFMFDRDNQQRLSAQHIYQCSNFVQLNHWSIVSGWLSTWPPPRVTAVVGDDAIALFRRELLLYCIIYRQLSSHGKSFGTWSEMPLPTLAHFTIVAEEYLKHNPRFLTYDCTKLIPVELQHDQPIFTDQLERIWSKYTSQLTHMTPYPHMPNANRRRGFDLTRLSMSDTQLPGVYDSLYDDRDHLGYRPSHPSESNDVWSSGPSTSGNHGHSIFQSKQPSQFSDAAPKSDLIPNDQLTLTLTAIMDLLKGLHVGDFKSTTAPGGNTNQQLSQSQPGASSAHEVPGRRDKQDRCYGRDRDPGGPSGPDPASDGYVPYTKKCRRSRRKPRHSKNRKMDVQSPSDQTRPNHSIRLKEDSTGPSRSSNHRTQPEASTSSRTSRTGPWSAKLKIDNRYSPSRHDRRDSLSEGEPPSSGLSQPEPGPSSVMFQDTHYHYYFGDEQCSNLNTSSQACEGRDGSPSCEGRTDHPRDASPDSSSDPRSSENIHSERSYDDPDSQNQSDMDSQHQSDAESDDNGFNQDDDDNGSDHGSQDGHESDYHYE